MKDKQIKVIRPQQLTNNIAVVDGFSGTGKSLVLPLLSHLKNGEVWQIMEETEATCILQYLNKIDYDSAKTLVRRNFDKRLYELSISRNVNFRKSDDSSIQGTLLTKKYKKRMKDITEREKIVTRIKKENSLFVTDAHYIFGNSDLYLKSCGDSLSIYIFMLRNPAHLVNAYFNQSLLQRIGQDPMEVELCIEIDNQIVPYYVAEYFNEYLKTNNDIEKSILIIYKYLQRVYKMYKNLSKEEKKKFMFISFENFTINPKPILEKIYTITNNKPAKSFKKMYKHLNLPRENEKIDYNKTYKLAKEKDLLISPRYKKMLNDINKKHKKFIKNELSQFEI